MLSFNFQYIQNTQAINPLKCSGTRWLHLKLFNAIQVIFNFWHSGTPALRAQAIDTSAL